jgi:hypothetical protein
VEFDSHVCLVSEQPLPNLAAALDSQIGRERVVLLVTSRMESRADHLESVLQNKGRSVIRYRVNEYEPLEVLRMRMQGILTRHPHSALNATGGLKTMSILAFDVWRHGDRPVFYVERDNRLLWLHPIERDPARVEARLGLKEYFQAFGQEIVAMKTPADLTGGAHQGTPSRGQQFEAKVFRVASQALQGSRPFDHAEIAWCVRTGGQEPDELDVVAVRNNVLYIIECKTIEHNKIERKSAKKRNRGPFNAFINKLDTLRRKRGLTARAALVTTAPMPAQGGYARRAQESEILLVGKERLDQLQQILCEWFRKGAAE